jgi:hypothetical protein
VPSKRVFAMYAATDKYLFSIGGLIQPGKKGFSNVCEVFDLEKGNLKRFLQDFGLLMTLCGYKVLLVVNFQINCKRLFL